MEYKIIFNDEKLLNKDFTNIPDKNLNNILSKIENLSQKGIQNSQVKKLNNYLLCDYRIRGGDYRILFNLDLENNLIIIFRVLHRSKLY